VGEPAADVARFLALDAVFPPGLARDPRFAQALAAAYAALDERRYCDILSS
jgi:hypothetical protein